LQWSLTNTAGTSRPLIGRGNTYLPPYRRNAEKTIDSVAKDVLKDLQFYNLISRKKMEVTGPLKDSFVEQAKFVWRASTSAEVVVQYDFPNINRRCKRLKYHRDTDVVEELHGGFLPVEYLDSTWTFPTLELGSIFKLKEFEIGVRKSFYKASRLGSSIRLIVPKTFSTAI
jgi:hypothetical protein